MMTDSITLADIYAARKRLPAHIRYTPLNPSTELSELTGSNVYIKLENQQITNSFKIRGASNAVARLIESGKHTGVVCVSTGNHGRGIAFAAKQAGVDATIFMTDLVPQVKVNAIRELGATIKIIGTNQEDAERAAMLHCQQTGDVYLSAFDHQDIISGQGTIGLEIIEQLPDVKNIIVPLSGGGLFSGIAIAIKALKPQCQLWGVTMEDGAAMIESIQANRIVTVEENATFADSLAGGIGLDNQYSFNIVKRYIDDYALVSEQQIAQAIRHAYFHERQIVEGGGSVGLAAILSQKIPVNADTVILLSGGNINMSLHQKILNGLNLIDG